MHSPQANALDAQQRAAIRLRCDYVWLSLSALQVGDRRARGVLPRQSARAMASGMEERSAGTHSAPMDTSLASAPRLLEVVNNIVVLMHQHAVGLTC